MTITDSVEEYTGVRPAVYELFDRIVYPRRRIALRSTEPDTAA
jgi:hypothetical protein